ncbi:MAG: hypothetical protein QOI76_3973, partial [Frankiales bacterium]|nr:hypothetical protein [Frankiales bacterium]
MSHRRRRIAAVLTVAVEVLGVLVATQLSSAAPLAGARSAAVTSGDARFEVLSPTLVRTEYAGDAHFVDAPTFNAIGRDGFAHTAYTAETVAGWLTIRTAAMTLRYKVGSGAFGPDNLQVRLRAGQQNVAAYPWQSQSVASCTIGVLCEAEDLTLNGVSVATDHTGYTGRGFAAGFQNTGNSLSFQVNVGTAGTYEFDARYANSLGGDGQNTTRTLTVSVDGGTGQTITMPTTANWDTWALVSTTLVLPAGAHAVTVARTPADSGNVNMDSLALVTPGSAYPAPPQPQVQNCSFGAICEAESGTLGGGATVATDHNDYSGSGFVAGLQTGASVTTHVVDVPGAGSYALQLRYANAQPAPRSVSVQVGSGAATSATLPTTSSWDSWRTVAVPVTLAAGANDVTI